MKKRLRYLALAGILSISSLASAPTISVKAATNEYMIDNEELPEGESTNKDCKVSVSVSGYFTITLPKKITLSGDSGAGDYDVTVKGNIGSLQRILVEPEKTFKLTSPGKADVETSIIQPKTTFDWAEVSTVDDQSNLVGTTTTGTVTAGKLSKGRWSGTFKFNVDSYEYSVVTVEAEDTSGTNLDATAYALNKTDRTPLLESLVDEALVPEIETVNDVTAIFEIKSNEFDSEALTTFNVSAIAKDGDEVIMFKYNDVSSTWELLGREVVSNNVVEGNFTSYTPFSFVVVPNESNTQNSLQAGLYLRDNTLAADWNTLNEFCLNEEGKTIEEKLVENLSYEWDNSIFGKYIQSVDNGDDITKVVFPNTIEKLGEATLTNCWTLEEVVLSNSIKEIGGYTFYNCSKLKTVKLPSNTTVIGNGMFSKSGITEFEIPEWMTVIPDDMFRESELESIVIPDTVTTIGANSFANCSITSINIPSSVKKIDDSAFKYNYSLTSVNLNEGLEYIGSEAFYSSPYLANLNIPDSVTYIGKDAFSGTEWIDNNTSVNGIYTMIGDDIIYKVNSASGSIEVPNTVTRICGGAFTDNKNITSVTIPNTVKAIADMTFDSCENVTSITLPDNITILGEQAFVNCMKLNNITIPSGVKVLEDGVFLNCKAFTDMTVPSTVQSIGEGLFMGCSSLKRVTLPEGMTIIPRETFTMCSSLETVNIPTSVKVIDEYAFSDCTVLSNISLHDNIETIKDYAFDRCRGLTSINLPDNPKLTGIGYCTFDYCSSLTEVIIPKNITEIEYDAFKNCNAIQTVKYKGTEDEWNNINIGSGNDGIKNATKVYNYSE